MIACHRCGHSAMAHPREFNRQHTLPCAQDCECRVTVAEIQAYYRGLSPEMPKLFMGKYTVQVARVGKGEAMEVRDFPPRQPTLREQDLALTCADENFNLKHVKFGRDMRVIQRCAQCTRPTTDALKCRLCEAMDAMSKFRPTSREIRPTNQGLDSVADVSYLAEYVEWAATHLMALQAWLVSQCDEFERTCLHCGHTCTFRLMDETDTCPECASPASPVMRRRDPTKTPRDVRCLDCGFTHDHTAPCGP